MATISETRDVKGFDEIALQGHGDLVLEQGDTESVVIEADESILPLVKADLEGHRLVLGYRRWWDHLLHPLTTLHFRVSAKAVRGISISGSGNVKAAAIKTDDLRLDVSGSGDMTVEQLAARSVAVGISGAGKVILAGEAERQSVRISGSGNVQTGKLTSQEVDVHISGSGNVTVNAAAKLDVHISGSGSVRYHGQPQVSQHISGSGSVEAAR